jgi:hypothetical protein
MVDHKYQSTATLHVPEYNSMLQRLSLNSGTYFIAIIKSQFITMFRKPWKCLEAFVTNCYLHTLIVRSILFSHVGRIRQSTLLL